MVKKMVQNSKTLLVIALSATAIVLPVSAKKNFSLKKIVEKINRSIKKQKTANDKYTKSSDLNTKLKDELYFATNKTNEARTKIFNKYEKKELEKSILLSKKIILQEECALLILKLCKRIAKNPKDPELSKLKIIATETDSILYSAPKNIIKENLRNCYMKKGGASKKECQNAFSKMFKPIVYDAYHKKVFG